MKACCFTGHRDLPKGEAERLTEKARALILLLIQEGEFPRVTIFSGNTILQRRINAVDRRTVFPVFKLI